MQSLVIFLFIILLITVLIARYHLPPFLALVSAAIIYGLLNGMTGEMIPLITGGIGAIFALLGIPIYCGSLIAQALRLGNYLPYIIADLRRSVRQPALASGLAGYILSLPLMCCITPFIILSPIVEHLHPEPETTRRLLYITAFGSVASFILIYPLPVVYSIITTAELQGFDAGIYTPIALALSLGLLVFGVVTLWQGKIPAAANSEVLPGGLRWKAWAPIIIPLSLIAVGTAFPPLRLLGNINIALLVGAGIALGIVNMTTRLDVLRKGTQNAGTILFDLCGAGALGYTIAASGFAREVYTLITPTLPEILMPFILAALIQTAQGSRVVTAVVTGTILAGTSIVESIDAIPLVLMIAAGTLVFSYVSDPYFWLIKRTTGDSLATVFRMYTLPLAIAGLGVLAVGLAMSILL